jgi:alcohol dehydrogenase
VKAVIFERHGGIDVLQERDLELPVCAADEVLIRVLATGMNYTDVWARRGVPGMEFSFPHISGCEAAGTVEAVGTSVSGFVSGDPVMVNAGFACGSCPACRCGVPFACAQYAIWGFQTGPNRGAQAEFAAVPARNILPKPDDLSWEAAASIGLSLTTAWRALVKRASIKAGDFVLIWGAAGGLGSLAIQVCTALGARVIAIASSAQKERLCASLGAEFTINRQTQRVVREVMRITKRQGVAAVLEHVGTDTWETSALALGWGGTIVSCGVTSGYRVPVDLRFLTSKQQNYLGSYYGTIADTLEAMEFVKRGLIRPVIMDVLPLKDVAQAHSALESGDVLGKLVLVP